MGKTNIRVKDKQTLSVVEGLTSMKECFSAKSVSILQFNILALWGELLVPLCVNPKFTLVPQFKCYSQSFNVSHTVLMIVPQF